MKTDRVGWRTFVLVSRICSRRVSIALAILAALGIELAAAPSAEAQTFVQGTMYSFTNSNGDGAGPFAGLVRDPSGNLYGTTTKGGTSSNCPGGCGTVFELVNSYGTRSEKVLYSFTGSGGDGGYPDAGLIIDASGNLYGTTSQGGTNDYGTVFQLVYSSSTGTYTENVLYSFTQSGGDGAQPLGLVMDASGNLYGTTTGGGTNDVGTVFELVYSSGTYSEKVLHSFTNSGGDGANPAGLVMDASGNLYGTTTFGGTSLYGTVFELVNSSGTYSEKVLYSFTNSGGDGGYPYAGLLRDLVGNLYGTTQIGGTNDAGTVFELVYSSGTYTEKVLYSFTNSGGDGAYPDAGLVRDPSGNLYGTTNEGGTNGYGTVFELVYFSGAYTEKVLHSFTNSGGDGAYPYAGLVRDPSGNLYGTTHGGGAYTFGTVFGLTPLDDAHTTTTLTSSLNPATAGDSVSFTASVTSASIFTPTGTINFLSGSTPLGTATLTGGSAILAINAEAAGIGTYTITAQYTPDSLAFALSSGTISQTVNEPGVVLTNGNNTLTGNQTINGSVSATSFTGNGSGLINVTASGLNCTACVGNPQLGVNYAGSASQGGPATNALMLDGLLSTAFQPAGSYATTGANIFSGDQSIVGNLTATGGLGGASASFTGALTGTSANFSGSLAIGGGTPITEYVSITHRVALPALPSGACTTFTTAAVPGFTPGASDTIALGLPRSLVSGLGPGIFLIYQAWETSTTAAPEILTSPGITIQVCNPSGRNYRGGASGIIHIDVFKH